MIEISVSPVAFAIGSIEVKWYGIMIALAVLLLIAWMIWQVRRGAKLTYDEVLTGALVAIPSAVVFSRLLHVIDRWDYYSQFPDQIVGFEGLTIYGAIIGGALGIWIYSRFSKFRFGYVMDTVTPVVPLAQALGRVGCLLNGCCYGAETDAFCGVVYTNPDTAAPIGIAVHPTQAYEILFLLVVSAVIFKIKGKLKVEGSLFLIYISLYALWRFAIGFLREGTDFLFGLQQAQAVSLAVLIIVVPIFIYRIIQARRQAALDVDSD